MTRMLSNLEPSKAKADAPAPQYTFSIQTEPRDNAQADAQCLRRMLARWIAHQIVSKAQEAKQ